MELKKFFKKPSKIKSFLITPQFLATLSAGLIIGYLLFVPPINGYADNGDFARAIYINGIYPLSSHYTYLDYLHQYYGIMQYYNEHQAMLFSSQGVFIKLAIFLNQFFFNKKIFDIRFMGVVYYLFYLGGIYFLTAALTVSSKKKTNYLIAGLVVFIFADSSWTLYFNSFFAEPVMIIAMLYLTASIIMLGKVNNHRLLFFAIYFIASFILVTVKQQNAPLALSLSLIIVGLFFVFREKKYKYLMLFSMILLLMTGFATYELITSDFSQINKYQTVTRGVFLEEKDPGKVLKKSGISQQFGLLKGQTYGQTYSQIPQNSETIKIDFLDKFNFGWVLKYYITHPNQFLQMLDIAAKDVYLVQVRAVGDYQKANGVSSQQQSHYFTLFSIIMGAFFPKKIGFYILLCLVLLILYVIVGYVGFKNDENELILRCFRMIAFITMILGTFVISIVGDGDADLAKHLIMVPLTINLIILEIFSDVLQQTFWHPLQSRRNSSDEPNKQS
jgi:hypothetical protein